MLLLHCLMFTVKCCNADVRDENLDHRDVHCKSQTAFLIRLYEHHVIPVHVF